MPMTAEAKSALSKTIRRLRERLLDDLHGATDEAYRLSVAAKEAKLDEAGRIKRGRLESWIAEQVRALPKKQQSGASERFRREVEKEAASTFLNRIVFLRLLEAAELRDEKVVTGGWESLGYKQFREFAAELVRGDESEGYERLLRLVFDDLAVDLPGLFGDVGLISLVPIPPATLRAVVEAFDDPALESCWTDDMTLGWVYQYWNDPEREAIDAKLNDGGKVEPHEIASKTQMFTERYMVDWLLQNSLGPMWLAMCKKNGWTPEVEADGTLARLEERRVEWRAKRDAEEVELTDLMPLHTDAERRWAYYVPQPIPDDAVEHAIDSVRGLKILDPAVGSGHFLVVAFDLLVALYHEEARHRGQEGQPQWSDAAIVERILEHNLHGIDLDPRAVQIAAAALWLKSQQACREAQPARLNLLASNLRLGALPDNDPALLEFRRQVEEQTGIPSRLTDTILHALKGADHLGSLLKVDRAVDEAIEAHERAVTARFGPRQEVMFGSPLPQQGAITFDANVARKSLIERLEQFLADRSGNEDLGLRLRGEQLAAGVRLVRLLREGSYDVLVGNPPYQGTQQLEGIGPRMPTLPHGRTDLYSFFIERAVELARWSSRVALVTSRHWMLTMEQRFLREWIGDSFSIDTIADLGKGAFSSIKGERVSVACFVLRKAPASSPMPSCGPYCLGHPLSDQWRQTAASLICRERTQCSDQGRYRNVELKPLLHWWDDEKLDRLRDRCFASLAVIKNGMQTSDNTRFLRNHWETQVLDFPDAVSSCADAVCWVPYIKGAAGRSWQAPVQHLVLWGRNGLEVKVFNEHAYGSFSRKIYGEEWFFRPGIAFAGKGNRFSARAYDFKAIFDIEGRGVFTQFHSEVLCALNSCATREIVLELNPTIHTTVGDVARAPVPDIKGSDEVVAVVREAFEQSERHREPARGFLAPGPSTWRHAQIWAQGAVDRPAGEPLPAYEEKLDPEPSSDHLSFSLGLAMGRFSGAGLTGSEVGTVETLPSGICFLDGSLEKGAAGDSLAVAAARLLLMNWEAHGAEIDPNSDLRCWLRLKFFDQVHRPMYENRPIYFPLSSGKRSFVAYVSIHRWTADTLRAVLADHLHPALLRLQGEIADLSEARQGTDKKAAREAERRYDRVLKWKDELVDFIGKVEQCSEKGPPSPDDNTPGREVDACYVMNPDDGVMINSAALWPLLEPQWKDPKKWWKELASAKGKKDYDWSHLAARYFPSRVDAKCKEDPSLGVAHGCFWKYHPEIAYKWELRLQDEIGQDFTIDEEGSDRYRAAFEREHSKKVDELIATEQRRCELRRKKAEKEAGGVGPLFDSVRSERGDGDAA